MGLGVARAIQGRAVVEHGAEQPLRRDTHALVRFGYRSRQGTLAHSAA